MRKTARLKEGSPPRDSRRERRNELERKGRAAGGQRALPAPRALTSAPSREGRRVSPSPRRTAPGPGHTCPPQMSFSSSASKGGAAPRSAQLTAPPNRLPAPTRFAEKRTGILLACLAGVTARPSRARHACRETRKQVRRFSLDVSSWPVESTEPRRVAHTGCRRRHSPPTHPAAPARTFGSMVTSQGGSGDPHSWYVFLDFGRRAPHELCEASGVCGTRRQVAGATHGSWQPGERA